MTRSFRVDLRRWPDVPLRCVDGVLLGEDNYRVWVEDVAEFES